MQKSLATQITDLGIPISTREEHVAKMHKYFSLVLSQGKILDVNGKIINALFPLLIGMVMASLTTFAALLGIIISGYTLGIFLALITELLVTFYVAFAVYDLAFQKTKLQKLGFYISLVFMISVLAVEVILYEQGLQKAVVLGATLSFFAVMLIALSEFLVFKKYGLPFSFSSETSGSYPGHITTPAEMVLYVEKIKKGIPNISIHLAFTRGGIYKPLSATPERSCTLYCCIVSRGKEYVYIGDFWSR